MRSTNATECGSESNEEVDLMIHITFCNQRRQGWFGVALTIWSL